MRPPSWIQDLPVASPSLPFQSLLSLPLSLIINSNILKIIDRERLGTRQFVGGVCLRSRKIFSALFSRNNFFTRRGHFKEIQVKGNLFDCSRILTVASFAYKQQKLVSEFFISKYFFFKSHFVLSIHIFLILFQTCSVTFH